MADETPENDDRAVAAAERRRHGADAVEAEAAAESAPAPATAAGRRAGGRPAAEPTQGPRGHRRLQRYGKRPPWWS